MFRQILAGAPFLLIVIGISYFAPSKPLQDDCFSLEVPYECLSQKAEALAESGDIEGALQYAVSVIGSFERNTLHMVEHAIGHYAYSYFKDPLTALAILPDDALTKEKYLLYEGYLHGVLQEYFSDNIAHIDPLELAHVSCGTHYLSESEIPDLLQGKECLHGVGHALMTAYDSDLSASLRICASLPYEWMQSACAHGSFMELEYLHHWPDYHAGAPRPPLGESIASICTTLNRFQRECGMYIGRTYFIKHWGDYKGAFEACEEARLFGSLKECQFQFTAVYIAAVADRPSLIEGRCASTGSAYEHACIAYASRAVREGFASGDAQKMNFCDVFRSQYRGICVNALRGAY